MKQNKIFHNSMQVDQWLLDLSYQTAIPSKFYYKELSMDASVKGLVFTNDMIMFTLDGSFEISYDEYLNREVVGGEIIFIPKSSIVSVVTTEPIRLLYVTFVVPFGGPIAQYIKILGDVKAEIIYDFVPLKQNYPVTMFINLLVYLLQNGEDDNTELHEIKLKEIFLILRKFYTKEQFTHLFYHIIDKKLDFRDFVLENYVNCKNLGGLARLYGQSLNTFMQKFKSNFGISGYQWMQKQKCQQLIHQASQSGVTAKALMLEIGIDNPSHFNRFCKKHFNLTPKQFIVFHQKRM